MFMDFFREGGFGMYPTLVLGLIAVTLTVRYIRAPERGFDPSIWWMCGATALSGMLGFLTGAITTFRAIPKLPPPRQYAITLVGLSESMWNLVLALCLLTLVALIAAVGARGARRASGTFAQR